MNKKILFFIFLFISTSVVFSQKKNKIDTDGDGVVDKKDVDDDNDGIYDRFENKVRRVNLNNWVNRSNVTVRGNKIIFSSGENGWWNTVNSTPFSSFGFLRNYQVSFNAKVATKAVVGFGLAESSGDFSDIDYGFHFTKNRFRIYCNGVPFSGEFNYKHKDDFRIAYERNKIKFYHNDRLIEKITVTENLDFYFDTSFKGTYSNFRKTIFSNLKISATFGNKDLDGDGVNNSKDLDSDGDGCFDVQEAGYEDADNDGILGTGIPVVNKKGKVISAIGYNETPYNNDEDNDDEDNDDEDNDDDDDDMNYDFLNPDVHLCDSELIGITIDTRNLPSSSYKVTYDQNIQENLVSGTQDSEVFVETGSDNGEDKIILISVEKTSKAAELDLRITKNTQGYKIEVFQQGVWLLLSPEFYKVEGDKVSFLNKKLNDTYVFSSNLVNGVEYDRTASLILSIDSSVSVEGAVLEIIDPNNVLTTVNPDISQNSFVWDGTQASAGVYKFKIQLQGKFFNGQFLIQ